MLQTREIEHNNLIYKNKMPFHSNICVCYQPMVCIPPLSKSFVFCFKKNTHTHTQKKEKSILIFLEQSLTTKLVVTYGYNFTQYL